MLRHLPCSPAPPLAPTTAQAHDARCWLTTPARSAAPRRGSGTLVQTVNLPTCAALLSPLQCAPAFTCRSRDFPLGGRHNLRLSDYPRSGKGF
jgi:hypothetical protein